MRKIHRNYIIYQSIVTFSGFLDIKIAAITFSLGVGPIYLSFVIGYLALAFPNIISYFLIVDGGKQLVYFFHIELSGFFKAMLIISPTTE
jgi:hypothetical protein